MKPRLKRSFTAGEIAMLRPVFGDRIAYDRVRLHDHRWMFFFPKDRAMAPNGHVYLPGGWYRPDLSAAGVPLHVRSNLVHEATHLYQTYGLRQWVWLRGPFDRNYDYALVPGKRFEDYGLEQMGMIAQHYFELLHGGRTGLPYRLADYQALLPVR